MADGREGVVQVGDVINWEEKYVSYVEGDLRRDIQDLKDGQKALDAKMEKVEDDLRQEIKEVAIKVEKVDENLRKEMKGIEENLRKEMKGIEETLRKEVKEIGSKYFWPIFLLVAAGVIGGLATLWIH